MTYTQRCIQKVDPTIKNLAGVEAHLRCEHGTLDHLSAAKFRSEVANAKLIEQTMPGYLVLIASTMGVS